MTDDEIPLAGGRLNTVVRVGDTVRRPTGPWTPTIHGLLHHLRERGFDLGPEPMGVDDAGREILSYFPGVTVGGGPPWPDWVWDEALLAEMGEVTARFHRAVADFRPPGIIPWYLGARALQPLEIVCHHDLAPYNMVFRDGRLGGIIDWDLAEPGDVRSELAFVAWQWIPLHVPPVTRMFGWRSPPDYGRRLRILLDSYGLDDRSGFIDAIVERVRRNRDIIVRKAGEGLAGYIQIERAGHVIVMDRTVEFLLDERDHLQSEIT